MNKLILAPILSIMLSLGAYSYIKNSECKAYVKALDQVDAGFKSFVQKKVRGKPLYEYINLDTVGVFKIGDASIACAGLNLPLPDLHHRK